MKSQLYNLEGELTEEIELPEVFQFVPREDLIRKAFRAISLTLRQPYGSSPLAGTRRVGHNAGPGHGSSRLPRTSGSSTAVLLAHVVKGRSAHSPRSNKVLFKKINDNERKIAIKSAIALTASAEHVKKRGHKVPEELKFPIVASDDIQKFSKVSQAMKFLENLGLDEDIERSKFGKKIRAGRGKMRGRRYKQPRSILVVGTDRSSLRAFESLPGVEVATADSLSIRKLAPGGNGGRLTIYTKSAVSQLGRQN
ncbi:50S ribosomal protein L4 [Oxyplasma meridianum]|uniref:Large ribosomal subunit protein uL4 n=1 Tax=Oxyplasma meridianum TaxID=3073602 RepID=A0AAX4NIS2_9ARCH